MRLYYCNGRRDGGDIFIYRVESAENDQLVVTGRVE